MSFRDLVSDATDVLFDQLGESAVYVAPDDAQTATRARLQQATEVVGDLGAMPDTRLVISMPAADVGRPRRGRVQMLGRVFQLDQLIDAGLGLGETGDDSHQVRYFVREVTA